MEVLGYGEIYKDSKYRNDATEYLQLRERLKAAYRKQTSNEENKKLHHDNYGSFFGSFETVIAPRLLEQCRTILDVHQHSTHKEKTMLAVTYAKTSIALIEAKMKVQKLRETRDYSFLFSEEADQLPTGTKKEPPPKRVSRSNLAAPVSPESKLSLSCNITGKVTHNLKERKQVSTAQPRSRYTGIHSAKGLTFTTKEPGKPLGSDNPNAVYQHAVQKVSLGTASKKNLIARGLNASSTKSKSASKENMKQQDECYELSTRKVTPKHRDPDRHQTPSSKLQSPEGSLGSDMDKATSSKSQSAMKQHVQQKKEFQCPDKAKTTQKQQHTSSKHQGKRLLSEDSDEDGFDVSSLLNKLFRRNRANFEGVKDDDDKNMESSFADILREETQSTIAARKEDERERLLIEEEERNERLRKAKKRKLIQN